MGDSHRKFHADSEYTIYVYKFRMVSHTKNHKKQVFLRFFKLNFQNLTPWSTPKILANELNLTFDIIDILIFFGFFISIPRADIVWSDTYINE